MIFHRHSGAIAQRSNPESRHDNSQNNLWIPGLRLTAHPGMTNKDKPT
jgi:hypothetical protein